MNLETGETVTADGAFAGEKRPLNWSMPRLTEDGTTAVAGARAAIAALPGARKSAGPAGVVVAESARAVAAPCRASRPQPTTRSARAVSGTELQGQRLIDAPLG